MGDETCTKMNTCSRESDEETVVDVSAITCPETAYCGVYDSKQGCYCTDATGEVDPSLGTCEGAMWFMELMYGDRPSKQETLTQC